MSKNPCIQHANGPNCLRGEKQLSDAPLYINRVTHDIPYTPETIRKCFHMHTFVELSIVIAGKGIHHTLLQTSECRPGDVYVMNAGAPHAYFAAEDGQCPTVCNVIFHPGEILDAEYADPDSDRYCYNVFRENGLIAHVMLTKKNMETVQRTLAIMETERYRRNHEWEQMLKAYLVTLLVMVSRYTSSPEIAKSSMPAAKERLIAQSVMRYTMKHFGDPDLQLRHIANSLYISESRAGRAFRKTLGIPFSDYIWQIRLEQACQLLAETKMTNEQIVLECGLRDVPTFYRHFKKYTGMTPRAYRLQNRPAAVSAMASNEDATDEAQEERSGGES